LPGNYVDRIDVANGAIHARLGNRINSRLAGKALTLRPIVVKGSPLSPVSWICGGALPPDGMAAVGEDRTIASFRRSAASRCRAVCGASTSSTLQIYGAIRATVAPNKSKNVWRARESMAQAIE
jgi:hypothetical protein